MLIENEFEVPASIDRTWAYLLDVEKVAPCAPGAELTETVDDRSWRGRINVKLGPVSLSFAGTVAIRERDDANHRVVLAAKGQETKGKGAASASVTSWLEEQGPMTVVKMQADISLTGTVAQLSRGLLPDVSKRLTAEFAECLRASITAEEAAPATAPGPSEPAGEAVAAPPPEATAHGASTPEAAAPGASAPVPTRSTAPRPARSIGVIRLGMWATWRAIVRAVRRLLGRT